MYRITQTDLSTDNTLTLDRKINGNNNDQNKTTFRHLKANLKADTNYILGRSERHWMLFPLL